MGSPFQDSFRRKKPDPNRSGPFPNREKTKTMNQNNAETIDLTNAEAVAAHAENLRRQADEMEARLRTLRGENDAAAVGGPLKKPASQAMKTAKKITGWALGVGVVSLGGVYLYSRLRAAGVNVPDGEAVGAAVGDTVATVVDAATGG